MIVFIFYASVLREDIIVAYLLQCALSVGLALWKMCLFYFMEAIIENLDAVILFIVII